MKTIKIMLPVCLAVMLFTACVALKPAPHATVVSTPTIKTTATETPVLPTPIPPPPTATPTDPESASEVAFWGQLGPMPANVSVTEHLVLSANQTLSQSPETMGGFNRYFATEVKFVEVPTPKIRTFKDLGYEIVDGPEVQNVEGRGTLRLPYFGKNGKILIDESFMRASNVYTFSTASGTVNAFIVFVDDRQGRVEYLIRNGQIIEWGAHSEADPWLPPVLYQGDLLWAKFNNDRIDVKKSNGDVVFSTPVYWTTAARSRFRGWQGHWILETINVVAMDGESLNSKLGFSKVFKWSLIHDKPVFLFQKQMKYGVSYDGQVLPLQYDEIAHGMCCMPAQNNPYVYDNWISFFGKRDGAWYAVVVAFKK
jgi:hypothetical protein